MANPAGESYDGALRWISAALTLLKYSASNFAICPDPQAGSRHTWDVTLRRDALEPRSHAVGKPLDRNTTL
jgi:hypothetical protein